MIFEFGILVLVGFGKLFLFIMFIFSKKIWIEVIWILKWDIVIVKYFVRVN